MKRDEAILARSPDAVVGEVFAAHRPALLRLAVLLVGDEATAEDVVQDAFLGLHRRLPTLESSAKALAYVRASVVNGRRLAFSVTGTAGHDGIWVLDTQAGKDLFRASHRVTVSEGGPFGELTSPVLSADGSKIYVSAAQTELPNGGPAWTRLLEVDVATGRQLRVIYGEKNSGGAGNDTWQFYALCREIGSEHLLTVSAGYAYEIDIKTTHTVRTPAGPMTNGLAW